MKNIIAAIIVLAVGYFGYSYMKPPVLSENAAPITIGTILSETGVAAAFGEMDLKGVQLAIEEINHDGGINGRRVVLVSDDDRSDPKTTAGLYKKQTSLDNVDAIIGSNFDFTVIPLFSVAKDGDTVVVTPSSSRIEGSLEMNKESFSMLVDFSRIVSALKQYMFGTKYSKLGVIHYASGFGKQITTTLGEISQSQGKGLPSEEIYKDFGTTDWKPMILKFKRDGVDLVFLDMLSDDLLRFQKDARDLNYHPTVMTHNDVRNAIGKPTTDVSLLENVIVLNWDVLETKDFRNNFHERFGVYPMNYASQAYEATYVLAQALAKSEKGNLTETLESATFTTPFGKTSFDANHSAKEMPIKVQTIKNGSLVELYSL